EPARRGDHARARHHPPAEPRARGGAAARSARRRAGSPRRARGDLRGVLPAMSYADVGGLSVALDGAALRVTFDRPDRRNAIDDARFWQPFATRGFSADSGATSLLPRRVGEVRARELLLLGRELSGAEAAAWGAIHAAVPAGDLDRALADLADRLAAGPTVAL